MVEASNRFNYVYSCELDINIEIKIGTLEGERERPSFTELIADPAKRFSGAHQDNCSDLFVSCQVFSDGRAMALPVQTSYKAFSTRWNWNEWLPVPVKYSELPRDAVLALTIWDVEGTSSAIPVGGTNISLFGKHGTLRKGMHDLKVWPHVVADSHIPSTTPGQTKDTCDTMSRLAKLTKKHRDGHMIKVDWLDRLTFREIEMVNEQQKRDSNFLYLMIEFPQVVYDSTVFTVVYFEKDGDRGCEFRTQADIVSIPDSEMLLENLIESKHHKMARSLRTGPADRDMKPDAKTRDILKKIVSYPPATQLSSEEQDLLWKFRFYLSKQKEALTKFLKCVNWSVGQEAKQALELMVGWQAVDVVDALELLSPAFQHPLVRKYAVSRLRQADDEELLLYLLQLVQALKYENFNEIKNGEDILQCRKSLESPDLPSTPADKDRSPSMMSRASSTDSITEALNGIPVTVDASQPNLEFEMDLATFLISRACNNPHVANYFYWYLIVECEDLDSQPKNRKMHEMYMCVMRRFSIALSKGGSNYRQTRSVLARQQTFLEGLVIMVKMVMRESGNRSKKIEKLQALLQDHEACKVNFSSFEELPLPLDPSVKVTGILPSEATLFNSKLMPCGLTFRTVNSEHYKTLFKHGDDLRQDQLILQMIELMDKLLRHEKLDLKLTPYKVLATSSKHGFVQFIDAVAIADILQKEGSIVNFFRKHAPCENEFLGVQPEVIDTYVKSCAGYCVVTYLLGIGDRHLDNLLITKTGKLFHVDFGYILGRDPKPMPPPMKLSKEMVEAMGGLSSDYFHQFKQHTYTAFLALRRKANLFLNLFSLMVDVNIPDIALEPDKTVKKVQERFMLHCSDEEAVHFMQNLIEVSVTSMMPALVEQLHKVAQYWRK
ncbi:phosphatidylinositol 3-kinase catalytic subunit type 3-like isoform X1 [Pomacea canaliculata]|uniref:phosphatidylinositol 3-kinase catalytic subunit type 3-like isoform X1 n=2 Tax=Pomacea canaliculata TaxID=400727 RepID=UPI000D732011|nr:phosphatidylinositol 3-kinase catalytic subunit type 3-like isoform X1 [Pomacea canaliculata]